LEDVEPLQQNKHECVRKEIDGDGVEWKDPDIVQMPVKVSVLVNLTHDGTYELLQGLDWRSVYREQPPMGVDFGAVGRGPACPYVCAWLVNLVQRLVAGIAS